MCLAEFEYNGTKTLIQCNPDDKMKNICEKFAVKEAIDMSSIYFLYASNKVDYDLTYFQTVNSADKIRKQMNVLVLSNDNNKGPNKVISKEIICPKCRETSKLKLNDYKVCFYDCKHKHKTNNISLEEFEKTLDLSNVICDKCKTVTINESFENTFFKCLKCDMNLCPLCKVKHDKEHFIINYEKKSYICNLHKEHYNSYCQNCEKNLCALCQNEHIEHKIISFRNILPNKNDIAIKMKELRETIDNFEKSIQEIIDILNKVIQGIELYYNINNYIFNNFERSRTYESLFNLINIMNINNDDNTMQDMNEIINDSDICNKFNNIFKIYKKINFKSNTQDEIKIIYKINKNENSVRIFGSKFVDHNKDICKIIYNGNEYELQNEFNLENLDINREDNLLEIKLKGVKNIKDTSSMFSMCKSLISLPDISKLDTSEVTNMSGMFDVCSSLSSLPDISKCNTSKVENMSGIFHKCSSLSSLPDISKWNTSNVRSMNYMFSGCKLLSSLPDISKWNISNETSRENMFESCKFAIPHKFSQ